MAEKIKIELLAKVTTSALSVLNVYVFSLFLFCLPESLRLITARFKKPGRDFYLKTDFYLKYSTFRTHVYLKSRTYSFKPFSNKIVHLNPLSANPTK